MTNKVVAEEGITIRLNKEDARKLHTLTGKIVGQDTEGIRDLTYDLYEKLSDIFGPVVTHKGIHEVRIKTKETK